MCKCAQQHFILYWRHKWLFSECVFFWATGKTTCILMPLGLSHCIYSFLLQREQKMFPLQISLIFSDSDGINMSLYFSILWHCTILNSSTRKQLLSCGPMLNPPPFQCLAASLGGGKCRTARQKEKTWLCVQHVSGSLLRTLLTCGQKWLSRSSCVLFLTPKPDWFPPPQGVAIIAPLYWEKQPFICAKSFPDMP